MQDIIKYNQRDLVLKVNKNYDPSILDLDSWELFIDRLTEGRNFQKEAIKNAIIYLASQRYSSIEDLVKENYERNNELIGKYASIDEYYNALQIKKKLFANIDLATGTGKSYVIYGIAQIMLGLNLVDKVIVLCPSITIEDTLNEKFKQLSGKIELKKAIPEEAEYKNPQIVNANQTIEKGDICIENIHAVYSNTLSSIEDSINGCSERVLILNDESHHIFNKIVGNSSEDKSIKKWKEFLISDKYKFKYILGFTGTAYNGNEYFNDVIYRYSLREAIDDGIVKKVEYVKEDDSKSENEKFQKIYQNHLSNVDKYPKVKPITILVCKDIPSAKNLNNRLIEFIQKKERISKEEAEKKVLIVTSDKEHKGNILELKNVDDMNSKVQWIVSVSMLTEGWDVKNVFQIVPWEDRAFNSKLLIAQVLGRGLRIPKEYSLPQPWVTVFNHESWGKNIRGLVEEILEIENRINSEIINTKEKYNFEVYNIDYKREEKEKKTKQNDVFDFSRLEKEGIKLESQVVKSEKGTVFESAIGNETRERNYVIENNVWTIDEVLDKIYDEFEMRDWEGRILKLGENEYTQNNLPPRKRIEEIIKKSMTKVGNFDDLIIDKNANRVLQAFSTLLRKKNKTITQITIDKDISKIATIDMSKSSTAVGNLRRGVSLFYSNNLEDDIIDEKQKNIFKNILEDGTLPRNSLKDVNEFLFKTPMNIVITNQEPERKFVEGLCKQEIASIINAWVKSKDKGFYSIEYTMKCGGKDSKTRKYMHNNFNPDFFIKVNKGRMEYILVVETKEDKDICKENKAKNKYAKEHFRRLNNKLEKLNINQKYIFHFLSPNGYIEFFEFLKNGTLFEDQTKFRCELENLLEEDDD